MMLLILILCVGAVYIFFRTYKKEMRERAGREANESQSEVDVASASPNKEPAGER